MNKPLEWKTSVIEAVGRICEQTMELSLCQKHEHFQSPLLENQGMLAKNDVTTLEQQKREGAVVEQRAFPLHFTRLSVII